MSRVKQMTMLGCLRHFVYLKFCIFRMFFFVSYTIRKWPEFREIIRNFYMQIYTKFRGILRNSVTCYTNFLTIQHRRHFLHTAEKLKDADWGWARYDNTSFNSFTAASRVFTTFCILEISYISNVFFVSYTNENILFGSGFEFQFLLFLYSFNTQYSPRFQRHLL